MSRRASIGSAVVLLAACGGGERFLTDPPSAATGGAAGAAGASAGAAGTAGTTAGAGAAPQAGAAGTVTTGGSGGGIAQLAQCTWAFTAHKEVFSLDAFEKDGRYFRGKVGVERTAKGARAFLATPGDIEVVDLKLDGVGFGFPITGGTVEQRLGRTARMADRAVLWMSQPGTALLISVPDAALDQTTVTTKLIADLDVTGLPVMAPDGSGGAYVAFFATAPGALVTGHWTGATVQPTVLVKGDAAPLEPIGVASIQGDTHVFTTDLQQLILSPKGTTLTRKFSTPFIANAAVAPDTLAIFAFDTTVPEVVLRGGRRSGFDASTFKPEDLAKFSPPLVLTSEPQAEVRDDHLIGLGVTLDQPTHLHAVAFGIDSGVRVDQDMGPTVNGKGILDGKLLLASAPPTKGMTSLYAVWTERIGEGDASYDAAYFDVLECAVDP